MAFVVRCLWLFASWWLLRGVVGVCSCGLLLYVVVWCCLVDIDVDWCFLSVVRCGLIVMCCLSGVVWRLLFVGWCLGV